MCTLLQKKYTPLSQKKHSYEKNLIVVDGIGSYGLYHLPVYIFEWKNWLWATATYAYILIQFAVQLLIINKSLIVVVLLLCIPIVCRGNIKKKSRTTDYKMYWTEYSTVRKGLVSLGEAR